MIEDYVLAIACLHITTFALALTTLALLVSSRVWHSYCFSVSNCMCLLMNVMIVRYVTGFLEVVFEYFLMCRSIAIILTFLVY